MSLTPWEEDILINQNHGIEEIQFSKNGEEFSDEMVGSLVEAAALLYLEDDIIIPHDHNIIYGPLLETQNPILVSSSGVEASNSNANANSNSNSNSSAKKEEHNAKERERRMKLSQSYFSLRSLLPNSRRSKKRWSSTTIIDKVVDYIPTLQKEIEKMKQKKQELIMNNKATTKDNQGLEFDHHHNNNYDPTVSIHQVSRSLREVIIQICINNNNNQRNYNINYKFSSLINKAESEGFRIISASTTSLCDDHRTLTCHLHFQMDRSLQEAANYESILRKRVTSWLC